MKSALLRITAKSLAKLLDLPEGSHIDAAFQDAQDMIGDSFTFRVRGVGEEPTEGAHIRHYGLDELRDPAGYSKTTWHLNPSEDFARAVADL